MAWFASPAARLGLLLPALYACTESQRSGPAPGSSGPLGRTASRGFAGQTLRVHNFANYFGRGTVQSFEERTGSKVLLTTYESNEEMVRSLESGAPYDIVFPSSYAVERLIQQDLLRPMDRERVPNLIQVPELFRNPPVDPSLRHCAPYTWSVLGLGVLSPRASPTRDPDSLEALFQPQGGPVLLLDDMRATIGLALHHLGLSASTREPADLERAQALLLGLRPRVQGWSSDVGPSLARGQAQLSLGWSGDVLGAARRNPAVRFVVPREGTLLYVDYACVPQRARSPELAFAFVNHLLDPQVAAEITNTAMFATPNTGAKRHLSAEARWLWATLDQVRERGHSGSAQRSGAPFTGSAQRSGAPFMEMLRDVGPASAQYEQVWRSVKKK